MSPAAGHQVHWVAIYFRELVPESARKSPAIGRSATPADQMYVELRSNAVEGLVVLQLAAAAAADDSGGDSLKRFSSSSSSIFSAASSAFSKCR